jgi:hypothetical protein
LSSIGNVELAQHLSRISRMRSALSFTRSGYIASNLKTVHLLGEYLPPRAADGAPVS